MKKRTTQLLSLMISAAMIASTPCLTYAADFSSETLLSDSEEAAIMTSQIYSQTGALSDCKPAVFNGKATWYASNPLTAKNRQNHHLCYTIYRLQGKTWKAIGNTKNTTYTDKSQAPQPNTVSVHTASQTVKKYTDLIHL